MSFEEEVSKFVETHRPTSISIQSEKILEDIVEFKLISFPNDILDNKLNISNTDVLVTLGNYVKDLFELSP